MAESTTKISTRAVLGTDAEEKLNKCLNDLKYLELMLDLSVSWPECTLCIVAGTVGNGDESQGLDIDQSGEADFIMFSLLIICVT